MNKVPGRVLSLAFPCCSIPLVFYVHTPRKGLPLVELHLDHNYIDKAENVGSDKLPNLRVLRLGFNSIENLSNLKDCVALATLDVRFNK